MAIWDRLTGLIAAAGIGAASKDAIDPVLETAKQQSWGHRAVRVLGAKDAALAAAKQIPTNVDLADDAKRSGVGAARFDLLTRMEYAFPGIGELIELRRRGEIDDPAVTAALRRQQMPDAWIKHVLVLVDEHLTPAQIALGIVRSILADPGLMPVDLDTSGGVVPAYPQSDIRPLVEAEKHGIDKERLRVLVGEIGLPMSPQAAAQAVFRGIIKRSDYNRAILEGDVRPEWAKAYFDYFKQIPTAHDGIEGRLRGWIDDPAMYAETARHGMSKADTDLLFKITGRPLSFHQVFVGERRGGVYDGPTDAIDPAFLKALRESNIRPEWYNLAWAQRYSYPSAFVIRGLTEAGDLTQAESEEILLFVGWEPKLARKVSTRWAGGTGAATSPYVAKADTQLWTRLHRSYIAGETTTEEAKAILGQLQIAAAAQDEILALWLAERSLAVKQLTAAQVKKAWVNHITNPATGTPWTKEDATTRLIQMGYTYNDASTFLDE